MTLTSEQVAASPLNCLYMKRNRVLEGRYPPTGLAVMSLINACIWWELICNASHSASEVAQTKIFHR